MAENRYDTSDIVRREFLMNAEGLKFASYRVRDMEALARGEEVFSSLQHHLTYVPTSKVGEMMLVNEIGATIYAMLEDDQVGHLREVLEKVEALDSKGFDLPMTFFDLEKTKTLIQVYRRPDNDAIEMAVLKGAQVLGLLSLGVARMFCTLASRAVAGPDSILGEKPPEA